MDLDAERLLVCKILATRSLAETSAAGITGAMFLDPANRSVYETLIAHTAQYGSVPTVAAMRSDHPTYEFVRTADSVDYLIDVVRSRHVGALLQGALSQAVDAYDAVDYAGAQSAMSTVLLDIAREVPSSADVDLTTTTDERLARYQALRNQPGGLRGIPSGFNSIDRVSQGFQKGQLCTFVGPPKAGKSVLMALAALSAHAHGLSPLLVGFEMTNEETEERLDAFRAKISHSRLRGGSLTSDEQGRLEKSMRRLDSAPAFYLSADANSTATLTAIQAKIENLKPDLVLIDGVYMMQDELGEDPGSSRALTNITRGFKRMAMNLNIPIIISTQVLEWKMDKKKGITSNSIGYSSSFAQDSDIVLGIETADEPNLQKIKVVLARNAPPMETYIRWDWDAGTFEEIEGTEEDDSDPEF